MVTSMRLEGKDLDELRPALDKVIQRFVGLSEPTLLSAAVSLISSGADKGEFGVKMRSLHPSLADKSGKLAETVFQLLEDYQQALSTHAPKASKRASAGSDNAHSVSKKARGGSGDTDDIDGDGTALTPSPGQLTALQIKQMMENAKAMINKRKEELEKKGILLPQPPQTPSRGEVMGYSMVPGMDQVFIPPVGVVVPPPINRKQQEANNNTTSNAAPIFEDKKKKIAELQAAIASKLASSGFRPDEDEEGPSKPVPLLLDGEGRAIDGAGKALLFPTRTPTLKANIRAQKRTETKGVYTKGDQKGLPGTATPFSSSSEDTSLAADAAGNKYFDERLSAPVEKKKARMKGLKFNDPGKYVQQAQKMRTQARLALLQSEIADKARKTGISTAARLAKLSGAAGTDKMAEYIPQVEWWDQLILEEDKSATDDKLVTYECFLKEEAITNLIEHPTQMRAPTDPAQPPNLPMFLTKREKKKLRRQTRRENWKEKQEKIRLGLEPPPAPKVRITNLMRVLGTEAVQDPTKIEAHVKKEMAKRLKAHQDSNLSRKLTPEQRKAKKARKMKEDTSLGVHVSVYRLSCLGNMSKRFKVRENAEQYHMTGVVVLCGECNVIVVEGGPKQQQKYRKLIMQRIKWGEDMMKEKDDTPNRCVLVWEGQVKDRAFSEMKVIGRKTEDQAGEFFKKHGVQHYWDAALSGQVLEAFLITD